MTGDATVTARTSRIPNVNVKCVGNSASLVGEGSVRDGSITVSTITSLVSAEPP